MSNVHEIKDLRSLLEQYYNKSVVVLNSTSKLLTAPGENYGGVMLSVETTIKIENEPPVQKQFVAKLCPANQMLCDVFNIQESFQKELGMYMHGIPAFTSLEEEYGIKEDKIEDMFAKFMGGRINLNPGNSIVDKDAVLLLENLKNSGYDMGDRLIGFDQEHSELIIKNLAKFHAASVAMKIVKPILFEEKVLPYLKGILIGEGFDKKMTNFMIKEVTDVLESKDECIPYMDKIMKSIENNLFGNYRSNVINSQFTGIVHSDYWVNNTMILRNDKGKPIHNKIVDLQLTMYNSIVHDLLFFLYTSIIPSVLYPNIDNFIKLYYDTFINRLKKYNVDVTTFSWQAFSDEIVKVAPLEIGHILLMFKPILTIRGAINDMSKFGDNEMFRTDVVSNDFSKRIVDTTLSFINRKWI